MKDTRNRDKANRADHDSIPTRESLLVRLKDWQDDRSWSDFFETYNRLIYAVAVRAGLSESEANEALQETFVSVAKEIKGFRLNPNGSSKVWDAGTGKHLVTLPGDYGYLAVARFDPSGDRLVTAGGHQSIVWNVKTGKILSLMNLEQRITNVEFNPDPGINRVMTTSLDNTLRIWEPAEPVARELLQITRDAKLTCATWSPDGHAILTGWDDGAVQLYETIPWRDFSGVTDPAHMASQVQHWRMTRRN